MWDDIRSSIKKVGFQCVLGEENTLYTNEGRTAGTGRVYPATKNYATINCIGLIKDYTNQKALNKELSISTALNKW